MFHRIPLPEASTLRQRGRRTWRATLQALSGGSIFLILIFLAVFSYLALAAEQKHKILSTFFDGVPTAEERAARKAAEKEKKAQREAAKHPAPVADMPDANAIAAANPENKPRPEIEKLKTWEEVLNALPKDIVGGPDWVKAVKDGVIAPRHKLPSDSQPVAPFTLDTLVPGSVTDTQPAFDLNIEMVPEKAPFYKVVFPHSSHTLWLNCSSCHPGMMAQRGSGMQQIFAGEYCGRCHGKVSFSPLTSCARCHVNLTPATPQAMDDDSAKALKNPVPASPERIEKGKTVYLQVCAICHGEKGDGNGPLAEGLDPRPRDFTAGKFKFRSTNSSSIPLDSDMFRTITRGIPGTSMPSFSFLSYEARFAITHFLKTFSDKFTKQKPAEPIKISEPPPVTPELLAIGKQFFKEAECFKCHGEQGRGDGPSAKEQKDDWGRPVRPFDMTSGRPKSGTTLKDYFRDVMTGLQGSPMPDFGDVFEPEQAWGVVQYVYSFGNANRELPPAVKGDIVFTRKTPEQIAALIKKDTAAGATAPAPAVPKSAEPNANKPAPPAEKAEIPATPKTAEPDSKKDAASAKPEADSVPKPAEPEANNQAAAAEKADAESKAKTGDAAAKKETPAAAKADASAPKSAAPAAHKELSVAAIDEAMMSEENQPPATFPHWFHRMRVRCAVCHSKIFDMKAGTNPVTMEAIRGGQFCGKCHPSYPDPKTLAWPVKFEFCPRCHVPQ